MTSAQMLVDVLGVSSVRSPVVDIVAKLERYQKLVENDLWDTSEAKKLKKELDSWGAEHEPELARLDLDIRLKELDH